MRSVAVIMLALACGCGTISPRLESRLDGMRVTVYSHDFPKEGKGEFQP